MGKYNAVFDLKRLVCIKQEYETLEGDITTVIEAKFRPQDEVIPNSFYYDTRMVQHKARTRIEWDVLEVNVDSDTDRSEAYLSYYGLPEPELLEATPGKLRTWGIAGIAVCLCLAIMVLKIRSK